METKESAPALTELYQSKSIEHPLPLTVAPSPPKSLSSTARKRCLPGKSSIVQRPIVSCMAASIRAFTSGDELPQRSGPLVLSMRVSSCPSVQVLRIALKAMHHHRLVGPRPYTNHHRWPYTSRHRWPYTSHHRWPYTHHRWPYTNRHRWADGRIVQRRIVQRRA